MTDDTQQPRRLPADVARCEGTLEGSWEGVKWRDECADCLRRTDRSHERVAWIEPHDFIGSECKLRIDR